MNLSKCPRCFTVLSQQVTNCPVCGSGDILDPSVKNNPKPAKDVRIDDPQAILRLLSAFKARYDTVRELRGQYYTALKKNLRKDPLLINAQADPIVRDYPSKLKKACVWFVFENINPITDTVRGSLFAYFTLHDQISDFMLNNPIVDQNSSDAARMESILKLINDIEQNVAMSIHLLADHLALLVDGKPMTNTAFTFLDRYYLNGFSIALKYLTSSLRTMRTIPGEPDDALKKDTQIALRIFELGTAQYASLQNLPSTAMDIFHQTKLIAEYFASETRNCYTAMQFDDWKYVANVISQWSQPAINDLNDLDERSKEMFGIFGPSTQL